MTLPTGTSLPSPWTTFDRTPLWKHSSDIVALSDSISASSSPSRMRAPGLTFQAMILPSCMLSESFGIVISYIGVSLYSSRFMAPG